VALVEEQNAVIFVGSAAIFLAFPPSGPAF